MATRGLEIPYEGDHLSRVAFPLGGMGAGMFCLEGAGAISHVSLRHRPETTNEPCTFGALSVRAGGERIEFARVLEGPVPKRKSFGEPRSALGASRTTFGLPRFAKATFQSRFPFGVVTLSDPKCPLDVTICGWSPFIPGEADLSSLPVAGLEYRFVNRTPHAVDAVFSFNTLNFMAVSPSKGYVARAHGRAGNGFVLGSRGSDERPWDQGEFCAAVIDPDAAVNCAWFRGGWYDPLTVAWRCVAEGTVVERSPLDVDEKPSPGASLFVPFHLQSGEERTIKLMCSWYVPHSNLHTEPNRPSRAVHIERLDPEAPVDTYRPWYSARFPSIDDVAAYWRESYETLRLRTERFSHCFYDTTLPPDLVEAVAANLSILKSPTVLRQADGRLWCWEGCQDSVGSCAGSCTHVWNYAQAIPHLFPDLERSLRATEFGENQSESGHQAFRALLPIREAPHDFHAAADGQLGGILKMYRDWRISGDTDWLRAMWPSVAQSLNYCIDTWDPDGIGAIVEPHHNTYDIEFWGPDGMCTSIYLGALSAAVQMGEALGIDVSAYRTLYERGRRYMEADLFNGEYFIQKIEWRNLKAGNPLEVASLNTQYSPEALAVFEREGPKYQYGNGCLSDGVLGAWMAWVCGLSDILDPVKVASHLRSVFTYNFRPDLSEHANTQRPTFALGDDGGLLLCSWPHGNDLTLPFSYSSEVWTGVEYQVASHLMRMGMVSEGLEIVRACRARYDGRYRNPYDEYECGHWYARALASYALIYALSGIRYDAVSKTLFVEPVISGDFKSFISTATGYGSAGIRNGEPFVDVVEGTIEVAAIVRG